MLAVSCTENSSIFIEFLSDLPQLVIFVTYLLSDSILTMFQSYLPSEMFCSAPVLIEDNPPTVLI